MIIVGVGGGSGSGKTYLCSRIKEKLPERTLVFSMDRYYRPFNHKDEFERQQINFSKPKTLDWELMKEHLRELQEDQEIDMPEYSFEKNTRVGYEKKQPRDIILIEGLHAFHDPELNELMDLKVFLDPEPDIRAVQRIKRDVTDRNRNPEFAARQYINHTKPMHHEHVEPTIEHADLILNHEESDLFIDTVVKKFREDMASETNNLKEFINQSIEQQQR